jgi:hypothetical protein
MRWKRCAITAPGVDHYSRRNAFADATRGADQAMIQSHQPIAILILILILIVIVLLILSLVVIPTSPQPSVLARNEQKIRAS